MGSLILDGRNAAREEKILLQQRIQRFHSTYKRSPGLAVVLVGNDPASEIYVAHKQKACKEVGIQSFFHRFPDTLSEAELISTIHSLNDREDVDGILVQLPLPAHINSQHVIAEISADKDVDGFHPVNIGKLALQQVGYHPCTPKGVMQLLKFYDVDPKGMDAVIVGTSNIVGRPMALELLAAKATVTICHRQTKDLEKCVRSADLLIVAIGNPNIIRPEWLQPPQIIVDVGINRMENGKICGDIPFDAVKDKVKAITPVPGGVGPMTIVSLLENCVSAAFTKEESH